MRRLTVLLSLVVALLAAETLRAAQPAKRPAMPNANFTVRILFGVTDKEPADWSGSVTAQACKVAFARGWHFNAAMQMTGPAAWKCATWFGPEPRRAGFDAHLPDLQREFVRPGVLVDVSAAGNTLAGATLAVTTPRGSFEVKLSELGWGATKTFLDGAVEVLRVPTTLKPASDPAAEEDYPSIAMPRKNAGPMHVWLAYQSYAGKADQIFVRRSRGAGGWEKPLLVTPKPGDYFRTAVALDAKNRLHVVWAAQVDGNFDLYERVLDSETWSDLQRLTTAPQPDMLHRMVADASGRLYLVWQGFRNGQSDVLLKVFDGAKWSDEVRVSESKANDWEPAIAAAGDGKVASRGTVTSGATTTSSHADSPMTNPAPSSRSHRRRCSRRMPPSRATNRAARGSRGTRAGRIGVRIRASCLRSRNYRKATASTRPATCAAPCSTARSCSHRPPCRRRCTAA